MRRLQAELSIGEALREKLDDAARFRKGERTTVGVLDLDEGALPRGNLSSRFRLDPKLNCPRTAPSGCSALSSGGAISVAGSRKNFSKA